MDGWSMNGTSIRFGQATSVVEEWQKIIAIDEDAARQKAIDSLIDTLEADVETSGFFDASEQIMITRGAGAMQGIKLDDREVYYNFFDNLKTLYSTATDDKEKNNVLPKAIKQTVDTYFGQYNGDEKSRLSFTTAEIDDDGEIIYPSVSVLKGKGLGACVEKSAMAHNMWLMLGRKSHYISSSSIHFKGISDEAHAFTIIQNGHGNYMLYDLALNNFGRLAGDPIKEMLKGEPLIVSEGFRNPGIYANACNIERENKR